MTYRQNIGTGQIAYLADPNHQQPWVTWSTDYSTAQRLTHAEVAEWPCVLTVPAPAPVFAYTSACPDCDGCDCAYDAQARDRLASAHEHATTPYAVAIDHPAGVSEETVTAGQQVTFHGSVPGDIAHIIDATVIRTASVAGPGGLPVPGCIVRVEREFLAVPATALSATTHRP